MIVEPRLQKGDLLVRYAIGEAMLVRQSARPGVRQPLERLGLSQPMERIPDDHFDQPQKTVGQPGVSLHRIPQVLQKLVSKNRLPPEIRSGGSLLIGRRAMPGTLTVLQGRPPPVIDRASSHARGLQARPRRRPSGARRLSAS